MVQEAKALAAAGYRVITPDLPAHGARYKEVLTLESAIKTLDEVISKEAGGQKVTVWLYGQLRLQSRLTILPAAEIDAKIILCCLLALHGRRVQAMQGSSLIAR